MKDTDFFRYEITGGSYFFTQKNGEGDFSTQKVPIIRPTFLVNLDQSLKPKKGTTEFAHLGKGQHLGTFFRGNIIQRGVIR